MSKAKNKSKLLLLEDVRNLGRKGELVQAKPGFVRNFLLPQKKAVIAGRQTIRMQERLKEERTNQAVVDKKDSEELSARLGEKEFEIHVKTDKSGHLFGSVGPVEILKLLKDEEGIELERRSVILANPIKIVGPYTINLRLKEEVPAHFNLRVIGEGGIEAPPGIVEVLEEGAEEAAAIEEGAEEELETPEVLKEEVIDEIEERSKE